MSKSPKKQRKRIEISDDEKEDQPKMTNRIDSSDEENDDVGQQIVANKQTPITRSRTRKCSSSTNGGSTNRKRHCQTRKSKEDDDVSDDDISTFHHVTPSTHARRMMKFTGAYYQDEYGGDREDAMDVESGSDMDGFLVDDDDDESSVESDSSNDDEEDEEIEEDDENLNQRQKKDKRKQNEEEGSTDSEEEIGRPKRKNRKAPKMDTPLTTRRSRRIQQKEEEKNEEEETLRKKLRHRRRVSGGGSDSDEDGVQILDEKDEDEEGLNGDEKTLPIRTVLSSKAEIHWLAEKKNRWEFTGQELVLRVVGIEEEAKAEENGYMEKMAKGLQFFKAILENDEGTLLELQGWWEQQKRLENKLAINGVYIFSRCQIFPVAPKRRKFIEGTEAIFLNFAPQSDFRECQLESELDKEEESE